MQYTQDKNTVPVGEPLELANKPRGRRPTGVRKYLVSLDPKQVREVDRFQHEYSVASRSEAIRQLIAHGLYRVDSAG